MPMTARALQVPPEHEEDPLLAAVMRAPLVPLTEHERALLAEVQGQPVSETVHIWRIYGAL